MKQTSPSRLLKTLRPGKIYRRSQLAMHWSDIDRDLKQLLHTRKIKKAGPGLYYQPSQSLFGPLPAKTEDLVRNFLKDNDFLIVDESDYTTLGLGFTQLYTAQKVLNRKRDGNFYLDGKLYEFRKVRAFPRKMSREFLLVDLFNNVTVAEDGTPIEDYVRLRLGEYNSKTLLKAAERYGKVRTQKYFKRELSE